MHAVQEKQPLGRFIFLCVCSSALFAARPKSKNCSSSQIGFAWQCTRFQLITQDVLKITILTDNQSSESSCLLDGTSNTMLFLVLHTTQQRRMSQADAMRMGHCENTNFILERIFRINKYYPLSVSLRISQLVSFSLHRRFSFTSNPRWDHIHTWGWGRASEKAKQFNLLFSFASHRRVAACNERWQHKKNACEVKNVL